jgi:hypothetical protein
MALITFPRGLSRWGWTACIVLSIIAMALLSSSFGNPWWTVRVWDSDSTKICNEYVSIILDEGVCSEDDAGKNDDSNCVEFDDSSTWKSLDKYLNNSPNSENADLESATDTYVHAKGLVTASIFFTVCTVVVALLAMVLSTKEKGKILYRENFQFVATCFGGLGTLMALVSFASSGSSDLTNGVYWEIIMCPNVAKENGTFANSYYTIPDSGYACAVIAFVFNLIVFGLIVAPGGCCFIPCRCCAWSEDKEEALLDGAAGSSSIATGQQQQPAVVQVQIQYASEPAVVMGTPVGYTNKA